MNGTSPMVYPRRDRAGGGTQPTNAEILTYDKVGDGT